MPQSKNRKKRIADHQKRLDRTRRKLERKHAKSFSESLNVTSEVKENLDLELTCKDTEAQVAVSCEERSLYDGATVYGTDDKTSWSGFSNISNLYSWCHSGIASGVASARDVLFPSRVLRKELEAAQQKMAQLEEELEQVKKAKRRRRSGGLSFCNASACNTLDVGQMPMAPPPAPPPPPLPPPPPPSVILVPKRTSVRIKAMKERQSQHQPVVSLDDLKSVRLRKPKERRMSCEKLKRRKSTDGPGFERPLRRSLVTRCSERELRRLSLNVEPYMLKNLRGSLRRVEVERSPGGTPLLPTKDYSDCGEGIGPVLTRALKRKFEAAYPKEDLLCQAEQDKSSPPIVSSLMTASTTPPPPPPPNTADTSIAMSLLSVAEVRDV